MGTLLWNNVAVIGSMALELLVLIVAGAVVFERVKNRTGELTGRVGGLEHWRDDHVSGIQPHTACILQERREGDLREWLERIERKIDRLEERIDTLMENIHERS
jgi:hypothetical protein